MGQLQLRVLTPNRIVLDAPFDFVVLRTTEGDMGILPGHAPYSVLLDYGVLRAYTGKEPASVLAVLEGFATVGDNILTVMSAVAEPPDKIEDAIANIERERAENKALEQTADLEMHRIETALRNSLVKMDISSYSIIKGSEYGSKET